MPGIPRNYKKTLSRSPRIICVLLCFQSFICAKHVLFVCFFFNKGQFYSRSFQKLSRTSVENSRTFQEYPTISQFSRTFKAHANHDEEKSPVILFTKTGYPEHLLQSILYKKSCHNTHCCRKRSSTDSFPFKCSLINI